MSLLQEIASVNGYDLTTVEGLKHAEYLLEELNYYGGSFLKPYEVADEFHEDSAALI
tara:strand:+ start:1040 stop:1210 length:171 start_codon:yes stop_codon:yes gene_type:complete